MKKLIDIVIEEVKKTFPDDEKMTVNQEIKELDKKFKDDPALKELVVAVTQGLYEVAEIADYKKEADRNAMKMTTISTLTKMIGVWERSHQKFIDQFQTKNA